MFKILTSFIFKPINIWHIYVNLVPQDVRVHFLNTDLITQTGYESKQLAKAGPGK